ncbi:hypothetical protein F5B22DRAFT_588078 [Xylaria bambusicola]|uniref:uncharacterized protein n=1 Tax=Xylaria bambusicola TaxID=326684 RepID=UPI002008CE21|nr:uncharacterized protein F5B22DRAFT_588078 [Xylaria bambusicola]KAI0525862.1 hypothetical protein F5B22DRAFT_588078 [Xylaria bambusicola]
MTTIPEDLNEDCDMMDFVNWDAAAASTGFDLPPHSEGVDNIPSVASAPGPDLSEDPNMMGLVFGDVEGDDWSYWALQHYESTQLQQNTHISTLPELESEEASPEASQFSWETPEAPCTNCSRWTYQCKRIREGKYKGYCTSCVALRRQCSFGPTTSSCAPEGSATFPANPWPTMGDRPETSILHEDDLAAIVNSGTPAPQRTVVAEVLPLSPRPQHQPKIGTRFSRESVRILKNWVVTHSHHPYPTDEERESLQKITGLNKTQITNWLANARRRGKIQPTRATSPHVGRGYAQAIDVPQRRGTPGLFENMNPLQRWANSPPENEPASVTAIARAVSASGSYSATSGSGRTSPNVWNLSDDGSSRSLCNQSSASSLGTSHSSGGSFASAFSNQSRGSSIPSFIRSNRGRRRRRRAPPKRLEEQLSQPLKTFQCTFCTETFRTKHDWQRHEKSLHLSLERWICSPDGPRVVNSDNKLSCVFCGEVDPDNEHIESHNFSGCTERTQEERTFYRKDHLRQHLRLVHDVKFLPWTMDKWRVTSPAIRSRCGFCGVVLDSWTARVDHLAEHFKTGNTMADWKGDWGFDTPVLEMVENSIPPYLIHDERQSPMPFEASQPASGTPTNAYELLKMELQWWIDNKKEEIGTSPSDPEIQYEACRIIYGAEVMLKGVGMSSPSWLCDLMTSSEEAKRQAAFHPRVSGSSCLSSLRINGKSDIFENCEFERELQDYVQAKLLLGLTAMDHELQDEACRVLGRMEERSSNPSETLANWVIRMINSSSTWLQDFRQRAHLPRSEDVGDAYKRSTDPKTIDSTIHNYSRLEAELGEYLRLQRSLGSEPTDADLQRQGRIIVYEVDDEWNQTAADDKDWLESFRERHPASLPGPSPASSGSLSNGRHPSTATSQSTPVDLSHAMLAPDKLLKAANGQSPGGSSISSIKPGARFLNDANCYRRLAKDLNRFVAATMSTNNPNRHVPTDEELKHQARWIVYDDDDPLNQTAADNAEWLQRFKIDAGILPFNSGPGLGILSVAWSIKDGGTGFEPPYVAPNPTAMIKPLHGNPQIYLRDDAKPFESEAATANHFLRTFTQRYPAPAKIFCSRDLENGLTEYVKRELHKTGVFPSDAQLQERARDIMSMQKTPCDDPTLLGKFKAALQGTIPAQQPLPMNSSLPLDFPLSIPAPIPAASALSAGLASSIPPPATALAVPVTEPWSTEMDLDLSFTEQELNDILQDVSYGITDNAQLNMVATSQGATAGGSSMPI